MTLKLSFVKKIFTLAFLFIFLTINIQAQLVPDTLQDPVYADNFDEDNANWTIASDADNLFIIQNGEYILKRKNRESPYSVLCKQNNELSGFSIVSAMKIESGSGEDASLGLIFMAQSDGRGAFVFEMDARKHFRVKQLAGTNYKLLTGNIKNMGWEKSSDLKTEGHFNLIEVKTTNHHYDLYINDAYQMSFTEMAYNKGTAGILIGPSTDARVDYFYIYSNPKYIPNFISEKINQGDTLPKDAKGMQQTIGDLMLQINQLTVENEVMKQQIKALIMADTSTQPKDKDEAKKILKHQLEIARKVNDSLSAIISATGSRKNSPAENLKTDSLSKALKVQFTENKKLQTTNKTLKDSLVQLKAAYIKILFNEKKPEDKQQIKNQEPGNDGKAPKPFSPDGEAEKQLLRKNSKF